MLMLPFACRDGEGRVDVHYGVTADPVAVGFDLAAVGFDEARFAGFPVIRAEVSFSAEGYRAVFGWLQVVTRTATSGEQRTDMDMPPVLDGADTPLAEFGYLPTLFDAPANPDHPDGDWVAESFLVAVPDIARTRRLAALVGFTWGYRLRGGQPTPLPVSALRPDRWQDRRRFLTEAYPAWQFLDST